MLLRLISALKWSVQAKPAPKSLGAQPVVSRDKAAATPIPEIDQWARIARCVADASYRTAQLCSQQSAATAQLDAATYALQKLKAELALVAPALAGVVPVARPATAGFRAIREQPFRRNKPMAA